MADSGSKLTIIMSGLERLAFTDVDEIEVDPEGYLRLTAGKDKSLIAVFKRWDCFYEPEYLVA